MKDSFRIFNDSFERCVSNSQFIERFYEIFINSSDEVKEKFKNTDMKKQKEMLLGSMAYIMYADKSPDFLSDIAKTHDREHYNIKPELYSIWVECMMKAVAEKDTEYNEIIDNAWRETLKPGIEFMIKHY